jgi:hypothetical protein
MTEQEWLSGIDLLPMLVCLTSRGDGRKFRLFSCACVRKVLDRLPDSRRLRAVEMLEDHADGLVSSAELTAAQSSAQSVGPNAAAYLASEDPWIVAFTAIADLKADPRTKGREKEERAAQCHMLRCVFGNPFRPSSIDPAFLTWNGGTISNIALAIYDERAFDRLPILADALEEAGCTNPDILDHCRQPGEHVRGCWVIDLILGKS